MSCSFLGSVVSLAAGREYSAIRKSRQEAGGRWRQVSPPGSRLPLGDPGQAQARLVSLKVGATGGVASLLVPLPGVCATHQTSSVWGSRALSLWVLVRIGALCSALVG